MADIYRDFVFCTLATTVDDEADTLQVDDTSRIPPNELLAKGRFFLAFVYAPEPGSKHEVVQVLARSTGSGPGSLTVLRGQDDTTPQFHVAPTALRGAWTAGMAHRVRAFDYGPVLPIPDLDVYRYGHPFYSNGRLYVLDPTTENWHELGGGGVEGGMGVAIHGDDPNHPRPLGWDCVTWLGSVEPFNMADYDIWYKVGA